MIWYEFRYPNGLSTHGNYIRMAHTVVLCCVLLWLDTCYKYSAGVSHWAHRWVWWRHQMEAFFALLGPLWGESSPHKGQWHGALVLFTCAWTNGWANNREAGDLRRHRAHYDVTVMDCSSANEVILANIALINPSGTHNVTQSKIKHNQTMQIIMGGTSDPIHFYINNYHNHKIGSCLAR